MSVTPSNTPAQPIPPPVAGSPPPRRKGRWFLYGCGGLLALLVLVVLTVAVTLWWIQRPIKPVVLTPKEEKVVEQKLQRVQAESSSEPARSNQLARDGNSPATSQDGTDLSPSERRLYVPGAKEIRLTEREINGLLNKNTDLGKSVRLEFDQDAVNAYVAVPIPQDFPIGGGKMFRARGRFRVSIGNGGTPYAILEDVSVFGVSLPKAWLGGIKGENLLADAIGDGRRGPVLRGIKSLRVVPGALVLELED